MTLELVQLICIRLVKLPLLLGNQMLKYPSNSQNNFIEIQKIIEMRQEKGLRKDSSEQTQMPIRAGKGDLGNEEMSENMMQVNNFTRLIELEDVDSFVSYYNQVLRNEFLGEAQMQNQFPSLDQQMKKIVLLKLKQIVPALKNLPTSNKAHYCFPLYQEFLTKLNQQNYRTQPMYKKKQTKIKSVDGAAKSAGYSFPANSTNTTQRQSQPSSSFSNTNHSSTKGASLDTEWWVEGFIRSFKPLSYFFSSSLKGVGKKKKKQNKQQQKSLLSESHLEDQDPERIALKAHLD